MMRDSCILQGVILEEVTVAEDIAARFTGQSVVLAIRGGQAVGVVGVAGAWEMVGVAAVGAMDWAETMLAVHVAGIIPVVVREGRITMITIMTIAPLQAEAVRQKDNTGSLRVI